MACDQREGERMISLIVAYDVNHLIGKNGWMPWNIKEDLKHFREYTINKDLLVGRKTFEGFKKPLPHRFHYVMTRGNYEYHDASVKIVHDIKEVIDLYKNNDKELVVIGGAQVYKEALPYVDKMVISIIDQEYEGDTYFPEFDENEFETVNIQQHEQFSVVTLQRKEA